MTFEITEGIEDHAPFRVVVYGCEGVGKTTFAVNAPGSLILDLERGTRQIKTARRILGIDSFPKLIEAIAFAADKCETLAIDSLDVVETMIWAHTCRKHGKSNIEEFGFGKGYVLALQEWELLLKKLDATGRNVILIGHAAVASFKTSDPDLTGWDHYTISVHRKAASEIKAWCDAMLFADYEYAGSKRDGKTIARSTGEHIMRTTHDARWDAKNRYNLPAVLKLSWDAFAEHALDDVAEQDRLRAEIESLMSSMDDEKKKKILTWLEAPRTSKQLKDAIERIQK